MRFAAVVPLLFCFVACAAAEGPVEAVGDELRFGVTPVDSTLPEVDAVGYEIELTAHDVPGQETFDATVRGTYVATSDLRELTLDFDGNEIDSVSAGDKPAAYRRDGATLRITLPHVRTGATFSTRVAYHGSVRQVDGQDPDDFAAFGGFMVKQKNTDGARIYTSLSWPSKARRWLPLRDHPRDTAQVSFTATFPAAFTVLANGREVGTSQNRDGSKTWRYEASTPMPPYDFHLSAYENWNVDRARSKSNIPISVYTYQSGKSKDQSVFGDVTKALEFYESNFGPYRWGSLSYIEEPIFGGGMEHASVISMDETLFPDDEIAEARKTAFHELAHHWSGNLVHFRRWNDFWLSEGFTEYLTGRAITDLDGADAGRAVWRDYLASTLTAEKTKPHPIAPPGDEIDVLTIFDDIPYEKGALAVRALGQIVGEPVLTKFLRDWFDRHGFGAAVTTDDFERELETASGKDLHAFFTQFVHGSGHPEVKVTFTPTGDVTIEQLQAGPAFEFPLDLDVNGTKRVTVQVKDRVQTLHEAALTSLVVDPDEMLIGVIGCGQTSPIRCKDAYRCTPIRSGVSACIPR